MLVESAPGQGSCFRLIAPLALTSAPVPELTLSSESTQEPVGGQGKIRVLLADDNVAVREILADFLKDQPDLELVAEAGDGNKAVALATTLRPDVVLMDISMPHLNGIEATRFICKNLPDVAIIGLSMHQSSAVENLIREAGAVELVRKDGGSEAILAAIRAAARLVRL